MTVFLDTSFLIAQLTPLDQWHRRAVKAMKPDLSFVTSNAVINETISLLQLRGRFGQALALLDACRANPHLLVVYPDASLQDQGWSEFQQWGPSGANAVDCLSFAVMRRHRIRKAFAFDQHFRVAGFEIL